MKRIFVAILAVTVCLPALSGCVKEPDFYDVAVVPIGGDASPGLYQTTFSFDSYKEMIKDFREYDLSKSSYTIQDFKAFMGEPYARFVERVKEDRSFPQPMKGGEPIELRDKEGCSNITFFVSELYGLPWISYHPKNSTGENFYIKLTYLPEGVDTSLTASEVIRQLSPGSPNINNLGERHKSIFERQIKLSDREVTALVCEYKDDSRSNIAFVYGDILVEVRCRPEVWSDEWFAELSFE
jgi:hypothetical protein